MTRLKTTISVVVILFIWGMVPPVACKKNSTGPALMSGGIDSLIGASAQFSGSDRSYMALGDSYTIGEAVEVSDRYPLQLVQDLQGIDHIDFKDPDIIAVTGWTTADLLNAIAIANPPHTYDAVTLLIGVNNQFQGRSQSEYKTQFTTLLQQSIAMAGNRPSHVLVLSIPDYSVTPFASNLNKTLIASQIDSFNTINRSLSASYQVNYLDVTTESRKAGYDPSLIAGDGLHFSGKEYGVWARLMEPVISGMLK